MGSSVVSQYKVRVMAAAAVAAAAKLLQSCPTLCDPVCKESDTT